MEELITNLGFPIAICIILLGYINQKDKQNREDTNKLIDNLKSENNEDKALFRQAIHLFEDSVKEFKLQRTETLSIKEDVREMKRDIVEIKTKVK